MAKSQSPAKPRGRPKSKSEPKVEKERSKSRGRKKSVPERGRSPAPKARKPSAKRSASKPRSRTASRSRSRKSEPKTPRSRSSSRPAAKKAATPASEKKAEAPVVRSRRTIAREAKAKSVVDGPTETKAAEPQSKLAGICQKITSGIKNFGYKTTIAASVWTIVIPAYVFGLHLLCTRDKCFIRYPVTIPTSLKTIVDPLFIGYAAAVVVLQCILSAIPIGPVVSGFGYRRAIYKYRSNGFLTLLISLGIFLALTNYTKFAHGNILITNRFKCVCALTIVAALYSVLLWVKAKVSKSIHTNHGSVCGPGAKGNIIHDFTHGCEVSPKIGETLDLSLILLRSANVLWAICLWAAFQQAKTETSPLNHNAVFVIVAQATHILLGSYFEINILKSAFINQGVGFITVFSCLVVTPLTHTIPLRYILDHSPKNFHLSVYIGLYILYCGGLYLIFNTNCRKYQNARAGGKKVLRDGAFAYIRHPNYLGELVCLAVATSLCGVHALLPWIPFVYLIGLVICRAQLTEKNVNYEYKQYAEQVRSRVVPLIY